jgi:hypothetical protein
MKTNIILFTILLIFSGMSFSQTKYKNVLINDVASPESEYTPSEPTIMIDPYNTSHIIAASNVDNYYYSFDGGITWSTNTLKSSEYGVWGDPSIVMDSYGSFYYFHLAKNNTSGTWYDRMVCQKSDNGGISWSDPGTFFGMNPTLYQDKEWAALDLSYSPYRNNIYVAWTQCGTSIRAEENGTKNPVSNEGTIILFSHSTDLGTTWSDAIPISKTPGKDCSTVSETLLGANPCVGLNGEVYVTWCSPAGMMLDKSTDGGITWLEKDIKEVSLPGGFYYAVGGVYRCFGFPSMSCDMSNGGYRGTVYMTWADQRKDLKHADIWIIKSTNGGIAWSEPNKVNDDAAGKQAFFSWMTIDQYTGYIYVVFYDRRNYDDDRTDVYLARSADGGVTFTNERISESPFTPITATFMGDYIGISAVNGMVRPIWTRVDSTKLSVWTAIIDEK